VNELCADYLGLPTEHPLRSGIPTGAGWDSHIPLLHPDDHEETRRVWSKCLSSDCAGEVSFRVRSAEGIYRWFLSRAEPLRANDGTLLYWIGVNLDIEELKQAEFYLAEGQRLAHVGSWAFSRCGFDYWSPELFQIHGLAAGSRAPTVQEYLGLVHPQDRESVVQEIEKMWATNCEFDFTKQVVWPDGTIRRIRCVGAPAAQNGALQSFVGTGIDVTEHELLTQELQRREVYLAEAQKLSHTGSFGCKNNSEEIVWSDEAYRIFEYDRCEKPNLHMVLQRIDPQDRSLAQEVIERAFKTGEDFEHECRLLMPGGATRHIHLRAHAFRHSSGGIEFVGAVIDITKQKESEQRLKQQEMEVRQLLDFMLSLSWYLGPIMNGSMLTEPRLIIAESASMSGGKVSRFIRTIRTG